jgi:hypothetical protein
MFIAAGAGGNPGVRAGGLPPDVVVGSKQRSAEDGQQHRARCNE